MAEGGVIYRLDELLSGKGEGLNEPALVTWQYSKDCPSYF